jgi:3-oxoacyl-[acyl-carrier protein] reductase
MADEPGPKVALITGAGRGLGRLIALRLATNGYALALAARTFEELEETRRLSGLAARDALILLADLSLDDGPDQIFAATIDHYGRLDVLINAAHASALNSSLLEFAAMDQDRLLAIDLRAPIALTRMAGRRMRKQSTGGTIINFTRGVEGACDPVSAAIDAGILAFSQSAATALQVDQIRITAILVALRGYGSTAEEAMSFIGQSPDRHPIPMNLKD